MKVKLISLDLDLDSLICPNPMHTAFNRGVLQLDQVVISLEVTLRSSTPHAHAPSTTLKAYFDSPG